MNSKKLEKAIKFLDPWLAFRYRANDFWPGFTVAISHKGKIIFNRSYGYANVERKEKLTSNHIFRIASQSKTFTATAIMQLVDNKKIKLDDLVVKYLSWLSKHKDKRFQKITVKHLLSHSAGIIRDGLDSNFWLLTRPFPDRAQFKKEVLDANLVLNSGKKMKYSNFGFTLLGFVIEGVSSISYNDYIVKNIIKPLGLKNTGPEYSPQIKSRLVTGYSRKDGKKRKPFPIDIDTKVMSATTGFYSTSEDLCKYFNAQMMGSGKLLSDESKKIMQEGVVKIPKDAVKEKYGLGFTISKIGKRGVFGHEGGFPGQITTTICDPKSELVVTVLTTCVDGNALYFIEGVVLVLDYFEKHYSLKSKKNLDKFGGLFTNIFNVTYVIPMGNHLVAVYPNLFNPFEDVEQLKYVDNNTLRIGSTNGFYAEGELVHYSFDKNGNIKSVKYAGATMLPERKR
ncbi:beta-lactamase family protein [Candidatus Microgenomates bacterium]|nr:beta-lactamase family protein [Candidatus Microgenomates bacterium]